MHQFSNELNTENQLLCNTNKIKETSLNYSKAFNDDIIVLQLQLHYNKMQHNFIKQFFFQQSENKH